MRSSATVAEVVVAFLERCGVEAAFGVISIHNMPFLDAIGRRESFRYVPTRGEAGAVNMADACARVGGRLGLAFTSTGTAAGNAAGALVEAQTAGTPLLHVTGQIDSAHLDRNHAYIHEARDQLGMLRAVSKAAYRVTTPASALATFREAVAAAWTAPAGPVSVEVPIDVQQAEIDWPDDLEPMSVAPVAPEPSALDTLAGKLAAARRPLLWLGGGARHAGEAAHRFIDMGFGVVTSVQGRGIVPEGHHASLGAFNLQPPAEALYETCDAMLVVGSRLRSNETLGYRLGLPGPLYQIDVDPQARNRPYAPEQLVVGDSRLALEGLAERLEPIIRLDPALHGDVDATRRAAEALVSEGLGPYAALVEAVQASAGEDFLWVRDVTIANSTWGNRAVRIGGPRDGVHALGGGIGQGLQMAIGAAIAAPDRKVLCLVGDGGLQVNIGELATATQEGVDIVLIVMNSRDYEVIKNIQDAHYGGRQYFAELTTPDFRALAGSLGWDHQRLADVGDARAVIAGALERKGAVMIEVDMAAIGPTARAFAGPPVREKAG